MFVASPTNTPVTASTVLRICLFAIIPETDVLTITSGLIEPAEYAAPKTPPIIAFFA